jgi:hypothetical protein
VQVELKYYIVPCAKIIYKNVSAVYIYDISYKGQCLRGRGFPADGSAGGGDDSSTLQKNQQQFPLVIQVLLF